MMDTSNLLVSCREYRISIYSGVPLRIYNDGEVWVYAGEGGILRFDRTAGALFEAMVVRHVLSKAKEGTSKL